MKATPTRSQKLTQNKEHWQDEPGSKQSGEKLLRTKLFA